MEDNTSIVVNEPVVARPMTSYSDVMAYLHGIKISREDKALVGRQLLFEAKNENIANALSRLDHLSTLDWDWDGYGASKVSSKVIENIKSVLSISRDTDWMHWMISPESNGSLCLQSSQAMSSISVGAEEFSYYSCTPEREVGEDHILFSPKRLLGIMRKIV